MITLASRNLCSGCTACQVVCQRGAIMMKEDGEGFLYPVVDSSLCLDCGACAKACPALNPNEKRFPRVCYAAWSPNDELRKNSSSGGVFSELAIPVLKSGGCVYGCVMEPGTFRVFHAKAENEQALSAMRKSKYVQSDLGGIFLDVRREVVSGRRVLFSGTPCQISGLRGFLGRDYANLLMVGVICHGTPSYKLMMNFIRSKENKGNTKFWTFDFRSKAISWKKFAIQCDDEQGVCRYVESSWTNSYMNLFNGNVAFRESCYNCMSRSGRSPADLLIGDFWGVEKLCPEMDDQKGTSIVLAYSERGVAAIEDVGLVIKKVSFDMATRFNRNVQGNAKRPWLRNMVYSMTKWFPFDFVVLLNRMMTISAWKIWLYPFYRPVRPILVWLGLKK